MLAVFLDFLRRVYAAHPQNVTGDEIKPWFMSSHRSKGKNNFSFPQNLAVLLNEL